MSPAGLLATYRVVHACIHFSTQILQRQQRFMQLSATVGEQTPYARDVLMTNDYECDPSVNLRIGGILRVQMRKKEGNREFSLRFSFNVSGITISITEPFVTTAFIHSRNRLHKLGQAPTA